MFSTLLTALEPLMSHTTRACNVSHEQVSGLPAILARRWQQTRYRSHEGYACKLTGGASVRRRTCMIYLKETTTDQHAGRS